jgi:hypothetical protein
MAPGFINPSQDARFMAAVEMVLDGRTENWLEGNSSYFQCMLHDLGLAKSVVKLIFGVEATPVIDWEVFLLVQETILATALLRLEDEIGGSS